MKEEKEAIVYYDRILRHSAEAILYKIDNRDVWIPKSLHDDFEDGSLAVAEWFAIKEELI